MAAGFNVDFRIWSMIEQADTYVGGSSLSGTCKYSHIRGRMQQQPITQVFLEQGMETDKVFNILLIPGTLNIEERDELELTMPKDHTFYGDRFRVMSVRPSDHNPRDPRNYLMIQATRSVKAHAQQ